MLPEAAEDGWDGGEILAWKQYRMKESALFLAQPTRAEAFLKTLLLQFDGSCGRRRADSSLSGNSARDQTA